jgi:hypothetical protein
MSSIGDWPTDLEPYQWQFYLQPNTRVFASPITRTRQTIVGQGPRWVGTGSFRFRTRRKEQRFEAMLDKLKGQANTVQVWDFGNRDGRPLGPALDLSSITAITYLNTLGSPGGLTGFTNSGSPTLVTGFYGGAGGVTVYGNFAIGAESVVVRGFPQHTTQLYAGDQVQIGRFMYRILDDATSNGLSRATLSLNRPLVEAAAHEDEVVLVRPRTPMALLDDDQSRRSLGVNTVREYTVSLIEDLT